MIKKIKKIILYLMFIFLVVKLLECGFYGKSQTTSSNRSLTRIKYKEFDYGDYKTVKLLHTVTR